MTRDRIGRAPLVKDGEQDRPTHRVAGLWPANLRASFLCSFTGVVFAVALAALLYHLVDRRVMTSRARYFTNHRGASLAALGFTLIAIGCVGGYAYGHMHPDGPVHVQEPLGR